MADMVMTTALEAHPNTAAAGPLSTPWSCSKTLLFRLCLRWTRGNPSEAEDLLSEACLRGIEAQSGGLVIRSPMSFWTSTIANLARDKYRARRTSSGGSPSYSRAVGDIPVSNATAPDHLADVRERLQMAFARLEKMPPRQRSALLLRSLGDDYSSIARVVGTSEQSARKLVQSGRAALHESD
jgi:RNA polymerase sigma factor (sigma-70 family)